MNLQVGKAALWSLTSVAEAVVALNLNTLDMMIVNSTVCES